MSAELENIEKAKNVEGASESAQTRADIVFPSLQADITKGEIKPGTKISETESFISIIDASWFKAT